MKRYIRPATHATRQRARAKDWAPAFLKAFAETHLVCEAAKRAGVHRTTVWRRRKEDEEFAQAWEDAEERSTEELEQVAVRRATEGSDQLLMFLLRARRPKVYSERYRIEHAGQLERPEITIPNIHDPAVQRASTKFLHEVNVAREHQLAKEGKLGGRTVEDVDERARRFGKILEGRED